MHDRDPHAARRNRGRGFEIRVLRVRQAKTGKSLDIELSGELEKLVNECLAEGLVHQTFMHRDDGKRYTYDGISCMFRRYVKKCGLKDFGLYDPSTVGLDQEVLPPSDRASQDGGTAFAPGSRPSVPSVTRVRIPVTPQQRV